MVRMGKGLVAFCLLWTTASTLSVYPHQLAYFNEAAGGPENGYKHLLGSNLDWGQDLLLLRDWSGERKISVRRISVNDHNIQEQSAQCLIGTTKDSNSKWQAVSVNWFYARDSEYLVPLKEKHIERVSATMFVIENAG